MQPLTITRGAFATHLYDVGGFMELSLANTRKLWKLMLEDVYENEDAINLIREWLPVNVKNMNAAAQSAQRAQRGAKAANARLSKAKKLQTIFNEMAEDAYI